jgi:hypothetical protein
MRTINWQVLLLGVSCEAGGISRNSGDPAQEVLNSRCVQGNKICGGLSASRSFCAR